MDISTVLQLERLAQVGTHTSGLMHELHNLFTGILLLTQRLQQRSPEGGPEWEALLGATLRARELLHERLAFLREEESCELNLAGPMDIAMRWVQLYPRPVAMGFTLHHADPPIFVKGSHTLLVQLFSNLLQNACEALPHGGHVCFSAHARGADTVVISVRDSGPGISEADQPHIFSPLFSTKSSSKGFGLGLYVCATICSSLGGKIRYTHEDGSTFQVFLPISR
jgi:signal transduction histidine kinase